MYLNFTTLRIQPIFYPLLRTLQVSGIELDQCSSLSNLPMFFKSILNNFLNRYVDICIKC